MGVPGSAAALLFGQSSEEDSYEIERSLRFNSADSAYLNRTPSAAGNSKTWTLSFWVKRAGLGVASNCIFMAYNGSSISEDNYATIQFNSDDTLRVGYAYDSYKTTARVFRDPSAWYHIVVSIDTTNSTAGDRVQIYVNGTKETSFSTTHDPDLNQELAWNKSSFIHRLGSEYNQQYCNIYLADVHFIDGQALAPTDFGKPDAFEVWQPKKFSGGSYGTNGFHLDFADNSSSDALGYDAAGSNDWTVNNLQAFATNWPDYVYAGGATYSSTETGKNFYIGDGSKLFDGTTNSYVGSENVIGGHVYFRPAIAIAGVTSLELYGAYNDQVRVNGTLMSHGGFGSSDSWVTVSNPPSSISEISLRGNVGFSAAARIKAIKVNGSMLVDLGDSGYDSVVDTPTNGDPADDTGLGGEVVGNYCTLNPLDKHTNASLSNGNLDYSSASKPSGVRGTLAVSSGKWYYEFTPTASPYTSAPTQYFGFSDVNASGLPTGSGYIYLTPGFYSITVRGSYKQINGVQTATGWGNFPVGTTMGAALDLDNGTLKIYGGGTLLGTIATGLSGTFAPLVYADTVSSGDTATLNFGQSPFKYNNFGVNRPSADYKCLCTANLPEPTIPDGRKYFDTKLYQSTAANLSVTGLLFSPSFVWLKNRQTANRHGQFDVVRGPNKYLSSTRANGETTTSGSGYGTGTFNSFDANGFTLGDDVGSNVTNYPSGQPHVAWAWSAGANSNRTYTVTVVNDGGNKYRFDGNGDNAVTLDLAEGSTYTFDQSHSSNLGHPLRFGTSSNGTNYTTGVTHTGTPGSAGAKTTLVLGSGVSTLYYSCQHHSGMGGQINTNSTEGSTVLRGSATSSAYDQSQTWSTYGSPSSGGYQSGLGIARGFNGDLTNQVEGDTSGAYFSIPFSTTITAGSTGYSSYANNSGSETGRMKLYNGNTLVDNIVSSAGPTFSYGTYSGPITEIRISRDSRQFEFSAVKVNGKILVDPGVSLPNVPSETTILKANPEAGFSISKYAGAGTTTTIAHGLNYPPSVVIQKRITAADSWHVYHIGAGNTKYGRLETADKFEIRTANWNNTSPTSSVVTLGNDGGVNGAGQDYLALCFAPVEGFSAMGSFVGTNSANGPFIYTGFKISFLLLKNITSNGTYWTVHDDKRLGYNPDQDLLFPNTPDAENATSYLDFLSNGFKLRINSSFANADGSTFVYMAFASNPFKSARAR